jgi:hypothetical protein
MALPHWVLWLPLPIYGRSNVKVDDRGDLTKNSEGSIRNPRCRKWWALRVKRCGISSFRKK